MKHFLWKIEKFYLHNWRPAFHSHALKDCEHSVANIVKTGDTYRNHGIN